MQDKSAAKIEVTWSAMGFEKSETFDTFTEASGLYIRLEAQGLKPELYVLKRVRIRL